MSEGPCSSSLSDDRRSGQMTPEMIPHEPSPESLPASAQQPARRRPTVATLRALPPVAAAGPMGLGAPLDAEQVLYQLEQLRRHVLLGVRPLSQVTVVSADSSSVLHQDNGFGRKVLEPPPMLDDLPGSVNGGADAGGHLAGLEECGARKTCSCGWDEGRMRSFMRDEFRHEMGALRRLRVEVDQLQELLSSVISGPSETPPASPAGGQVPASKQRGSRFIKRSRSRESKERAPVTSPREKRSSLQSDSGVPATQQDRPVSAEAKQPSQTLLEQAMHRDRQKAVRSDEEPTFSRCESTSKANTGAKAFQFEYDIGFRIRTDKAHRLHRRQRLRHTDSSSAEHSDNSCSRPSNSHRKTPMPHNPSAGECADVSSEGGEDSSTHAARRPVSAALREGHVALGCTAPAPPQLLSGIKESYRNSLDYTADARSGAWEQTPDLKQDDETTAKLDAPPERSSLDRVPSLDRGRPRKRLGADRIVAGNPPAEFGAGVKGDREGRSS